MKLLLAEDNADLVEALSAFLRKNQFTVDAVQNGQDAYDYGRSGAYDAMILDIMMPKMDGIEVLKRLRKEGVSTPVMMLTAKAQKEDRIEGFDAGADDYLPKPFAPDELIARLRALLRRSGEYKAPVLCFGDLSLDCAGGLLSCKEKSVRLSGKEFQVLELLMRSPNLVFSAEKIMERVWSWNSDAEISVVWVHISNLRKALQSLSSNVSIRAKRGLGYVLEVTA